MYRKGKDIRKRDIWLHLSLFLLFWGRSFQQLNFERCRQKLLAGKYEENSQMFHEDFYLPLYLPLWANRSKNCKFKDSSPSPALLPEDLSCLIDMISDCRTAYYPPPPARGSQLTEWSMIAGSGIAPLPEDHSWPHDLWLQDPVLPPCPRITVDCMIYDCRIPYWSGCSCRASPVLETWAYNDLWLQDPVLPPCLRITPLRGAWRCSGRAWSGCSCRASPVLETSERGWSRPGNILKEPSFLKFIVPDVEFREFDNVRELIIFSCIARKEHLLLTWLLLAEDCSLKNNFDYLVVLIFDCKNCKF